MHHSKRQPRRGLTLAELLVVLAILAILTTVAITAMDGALDQAKYDATLRGLENVQNAVLGPLNQTEPDGTRFVVGFVADVGRVPLAVGSDPASQLAELWSNPGGLPAFGPQTVAGGDGLMVTLPAGWRGPYLQLPQQPAGVGRLLDGWGNSFILRQADNSTPAAPGLPIVYVHSNGGPTSPYDVPLPMSRPFVPANTIGSITGALVDSDATSPATENITVELFGPNLGPTPQPGVVGKAVPIEAPTAGNGYQFQFANVPIGPKVLRAYGASSKSSLFYIRVPPGGLTRNIPLDVH